ncbi:hypothetical protein AGMMS49949_00740 [Alphaproteobacteria bacterium]|nr:hypothetical protein AGMMS49949_00740 [Alphaproteobacteria bacterium]
MEVIKMRINSVGNRSMARLKNIHHSLVGVWIKKMGQFLKEIFHEKTDDIQGKDITILEIDELFTFLKKR